MADPVTRALTVLLTAAVLAGLAGCRSLPADSPDPSDAATRSMPVADPETVLAELAAQFRPLIDELAALAPGETTSLNITGDESRNCRVGLADDGSLRWAYSRQLLFTGDFRELSLRAEQLLRTRGWTVRVDRDSTASRIFVAKQAGAYVRINTGPDESGAGAAAVLGDSPCVSTDGEILAR